MTTVLVVEDDQRLLELLVAVLQEVGFQVTTESDGLRAAERIVAEKPDVTVLDVGLPGLDGFRVCTRVRPYYDGRILVLTARGEESDELTGLAAGADDYLAKLVSPPILVARIGALVRRSRRGNEVIRNGRLCVDPSRRRVELDGITVPLRSAEFEVLLILARNLGRVVLREDLYRVTMGREYDGVDRSVDLRISRIRRHLGDDPRDPRWIKTVHGSGYQLTMDSS